MEKTTFYEKYAVVVRKENFKKLKDITKDYQEENQQKGYNFEKDYKRYNKRWSLPALSVHYQFPDNIYTDSKILHKSKLHDCFETIRVLKRHNIPYELSKKVIKKITITTEMEEIINTPIDPFSMITEHYLYVNFHRIYQNNKNKILSYDYMVIYVDKPTTIKSEDHLIYVSGYTFRLTNNIETATFYKMSHNAVIFSTKDLT